MRKNYCQWCKLKVFFFLIEFSKTIVEKVTLNKAHAAYVNKCEIKLCLMSINRLLLWCWVHNVLLLSTPYRKLHNALIEFFKFFRPKLSRRQQSTELLSHNFLFRWLLKNDSFHESGGNSRAIVLMWKEDRKKIIVCQTTLTFFQFSFSCSNEIRLCNEVLYVTSYSGRISTFSISVVLYISLILHPIYFFQMQESIR